MFVVQKVLLKRCTNRAKWSAEKSERRIEEEQEAENGDEEEAEQAGAEAVAEAEAGKACNFALLLCVAYFCAALFPHCCNFVCDHLKFIKVCVNVCVAYISLAYDAEYISQAKGEQGKGERGQLRTIAYEIEQTKWKFKWQLMRRALQSGRVQALAMESCACMQYVC